MNNNINIVYEICQKNMVENLETKSRKRKFLYQRWIFWRVLQDLKLGYTLEAMGNHLGYDHATVLHSNKRFFLDIPGDPTYMNMYNKCLKACMKHFKIVDETLDTRTTKETLINSLIQLKVELEDMKIAQRMKGRKIPKKSAKDEFIEDLLNLDETQYQTFKERAAIMLKSVKSMRTYDNTPRSSFNPKNEALKVAV
jgi:hypothetical protein